MSALSGLIGRRARRDGNRERSAADDIREVPEREFPPAAPHVLGAPSAGEFPYPGLPDAQVAAYRAVAATDWLAPRLTFTTAPAAQTRPMPAVPGAVRTPRAPETAPQPDETVLIRVADTSPEAMEQALASLRQGIDWRALEEARQQVDFTYARAAAAREAEGPAFPAVLAARAPEPPAPDTSRAGRFAADMRFRGGLPVFRRTARASGWRGLNEDPPAEWVRYTVARWHEQVLRVIAADYDAARLACGLPPAGGAL